MAGLVLWYMAAMKWHGLCACLIAASVGCGDNRPASVCEAGTSRCAAVGAATEVCQADGSGWQSGVTCAGLCSEGGCDEIAEVCVPGQLRCDVDYAGTITCGGDGQWGDAAACPENLCQSGECATTSEREAPTVAGVNDLFQDSEVIPFGVDFSGHIGAQGDIDQYRFTVHEAGLVTVTLDFFTSFENRAIDSMVGVTRTDSWPESTTAVAASVPTQAGCQDTGTSISCASSFEFTQSVEAGQGTYTLKIHGTGSVGVPGFDSENPYRVRIAFTPGPTLESDQPAIDGVGAADTWRDAHAVDFSDGAIGTAELRSFGYYFLDFDWYRFEAAVDGWLRMVVDVLDAEEFDDRDIVLTVQGDLLRQDGADLLTRAGPDFIVSDSPNCPIERLEYQQIEAGKTYYLRVMSFDASRDKPYAISLEYGSGAPEDDQPGLVAAVDTPAAAHDIGELDSDESIELESYSWRYFDQDWYRVHVPSGTGGTLTWSVDYTASFQAYGWHDFRNCSTNPYGMKTWAYLFAQDWVEEAGPFSEHLARSTTADSPSQTIEWPIAATESGKDYYFVVWSRENWDQENPYTLTVSYTSAP